MATIPGSNQLSKPVDVVTVTEVLPLPLPSKSVEFIHTATPQLTVNTFVSVIISSKVQSSPSLATHSEHSSRPASKRPTPTSATHYSTTQSQPHATSTATETATPTSNDHTAVYILAALLSGIIACVAIGLLMWYYTKRRGHEKESTSATKPKSIVRTFLSTNQHPANSLGFSVAEPSISTAQVDPMPPKYRDDGQVPIETHVLHRIDNTGKSVMPRNEREYGTKEKNDEDKGIEMALHPNHHTTVSSFQQTCEPRSQPLHPAFSQTPQDHGNLYKISISPSPSLETSSTAYNPNDTLHAAPPVGVHIAEHTPRIGSPSRLVQTIIETNRLPSQVLGTGVSDISLLDLNDSLKVNEAHREAYNRLKREGYTREQIMVMSSRSTEGTRTRECSDDEDGRDDVEIRFKPGLNRRRGLALRRAARGNVVPTLPKMRIEHEHIRHHGKHEHGDQGIGEIRDGGMF